MVSKTRRAHLSRSGEHLSFLRHLRPCHRGRAQPHRARPVHDWILQTFIIEIHLDVMSASLPAPLTRPSAVWLASPSDRQNEGAELRQTVTRPPAAAPRTDARSGEPNALVSPSAITRNECKNLRPVIC